MRVAGRDLTYRDTRFVLGRGDGFIGIWDRERAAEPIERFPETDRDEYEAERRVEALLFDVEVAAKQTRGVRLCTPRMPPRQIPHDDDNGWMLYSGMPYLITEEDIDIRWQTIPETGRFCLYDLGDFGRLRRLHCVNALLSVEGARDFAARWSGVDAEWREVPLSVPQTLLDTLLWVEREVAGIPDGPWYEQFEHVRGTIELGKQIIVALLSNEENVGMAVIASEHTDGRDPAAYLFREGDRPRFMFSLGEFAALKLLLKSQLRDAMGGWYTVRDDYSRDLLTLSEQILAAIPLVDGSE